MYARVCLSTSGSPADWAVVEVLAEAAGALAGAVDWSLLASYERRKPFLLAGGITPDNVAAAISFVRPDAIDVASGVESSPGIKDRAKIEKLIERVRRA